MKRSLRSVVAGCVLVAVAACATPGRAPSSSETPLWKRLYPLEVGRSWTFQVKRPGGETTTTVTRVAAVEDGAVVMVSGDVSYRYVLRDDGLWRPSQQAYLLKAPIEEGASWPGAVGGTVKVLSTDETVTVPAGTYAHCVVVEENVPEARLVQRHTFCPDVGPVRLEQYAGGALLAEARLVTFGHIVPGD